MKANQDWTNWFCTALAALLGIALVWAFWPTLVAMAGRWTSDPRYSHGYLVPIFAGVLLWLRRDRLSIAEMRPSWWGLALLLAGAGLRLAASYYYFEWFEQLSFIPCLFGAVLLAGGRPALRWSYPALAFLLFMIPLPYRIETALSVPLQRIGTIASTFLIQTIGLHALAEGNVIQLQHGTIGVVEACSGLSMLFTFIAIAAGFAMVVKRPWPDKVLIMLSSAPIAVAANVLRITMGAVAYELAGQKMFHMVFHDLAGLIMTPLAIVMLLFELHVLSRLLLEPDPRRHLGPMVPGATPQVVPVVQPSRRRLRQA
jgi:exosortase